MYKCALNINVFKVKEEHIFVIKLTYLQLSETRVSVRPINL